MISSMYLLNSSIGLKVESFAAIESVSFSGDKKSVFIIGPNSVNKKVLKMIANNVAITYGIANFSIGFAKDNNLKYVFI